MQSAKIWLIICTVKAEMLVLLRDVGTTTEVGMSREHDCVNIAIDLFVISQNILIALRLTSGVRLSPAPY